MICEGEVFKALSHSLHSQAQKACDQLSLDTNHVCSEQKCAETSTWLLTCFSTWFQTLPCPHMPCCKQKQCSHFRSKGHLAYITLTVIQCFQQNNWLLLFYDFSITNEIQIYDHSMNYRIILMYINMAKADPWFYLVL